MDEIDTPQAALELSVLQQAFTAIKFSVMVTDCRKPDNPIVYVNHAFEELTGYKLCDVVGLNPRILHGTRVNQDGLVEIRTAIRNGTMCTVEITDTRKDGTDVWVRVSIVPIFNDRQELTHFVGFTADITKEKAREEERDYIVAALAHDLKDQVGGAERIFALIAEGVYGQVSDIAVELLRAMSAGHRDILNTLENVLEVYRSENANKLLKIERQELSTLLPEWVSLVQIYALERAIRISCAVSPELSCIADRSSLRRVIFNLLENAIKFSPDGSEITVTARRTSSGVELAVIDAGPGLAEEELETIFAKLGKGKETRLSPGCGLGLYTCRRLVTAHGWQISCMNNENGIGARFVIEIPDNAILAESE